MLLVTLRNAASLQSGIAEQKQRLDDCLQLRKALTVSASDFVSSTLTDMATEMNTKKKKTPSKKKKRKDKTS